MVVPMVSGNVYAAESLTATGTTNDTTCNTTVKYEVTQGYEWSIHSAIDFGQDRGVNKSVVKESNTVSVNKNIIPDGKKLNIKVKGSGANGTFEIANGSTKLTYNQRRG